MLELKIGDKTQLNSNTAENSPIHSTSIITIANALRAGDKVGFNVRINEQYVYGTFTVEIDSPANSRYIITGFIDDTIRVDGPFNPIEAITPYTISVDQNWFWKTITYIGENKFMLAVIGLLIANLAMNIDISQPFMKLINSFIQ